MDMQPTNEEIKSLKEKFQSMQGRILAFDPTQEQLDEAMKDLENPKGYVVCSEEDIPDYI